VLGQLRQPASDERLLENAPCPPRSYADRVHDDPDLDDEFVDESEDDEAAIADENAHTLSIRRASGEEIVTIFSPTEEWSVYLQPGGAMTNAFLGTPSDPIVWVNTSDRRVERDEDGTFVIRID
jgi:hypothetical protein